MVREEKTEENISGADAVLLLVRTFPKPQEIQGSEEEEGRPTCSCSRGLSGRSC